MYEDEPPKFFLSLQREKRSELLSFVVDWMDPATGRDPTNFDPLQSTKRGEGSRGKDLRDIIHINLYLDQSLDHRYFLRLPTSIVMELEETDKQYEMSLITTDTKLCIGLWLWLI